LYPISELPIMLPAEAPGGLDPLQVPRAAARLHPARPLRGRHQLQPRRPDGPPPPHRRRQPQQWRPPQLQ
jgi:hypothetical protein